MALGIPISLNLEIVSGDDQTFQATIGNSDGSTAFDYSSYDVFFTVKNTKDEYNSDALAIYQLVSSDITVSATGSPTSTLITFNYFARTGPDADDAPLEPGNYYYDIQFVHPDGKPIQTWWKGKFRVTWHATVATSTA